MCFNNNRTPRQLNRNMSSVASNRNRRTQPVKAKWHTNAKGKVKREVTRKRKTIMSSWCNKPIVTDYNFKKERKKKVSMPSCRPPTHRKHCGRRVGCVLWQPRAEALTDRSLATEAGGVDMKHQLSGGVGSWVSMWGWEVPARYNQAHLYTRFELWNQCPCWEAAGWGA